MRRLVVGVLAGTMLVAACGGTPRDGQPPDAQHDPADSPVPDPAVPSPPADPADTVPAEWDTPHARAIWDDARDRGVTFRALGQEPGWMLELWENDRLEFTGDYGDWMVSAPLGPAERGPDGRSVYRAATDDRSIEVVIEARACEDVMSGQPFPATVRVIVDGRTFDGCGRDLR